MQRIVPLLPIALVLLAFAAAPSRPVNAQGSGQDPRFDDCVESVVYSILQAQHIEGGTIEADDVRGRNVEAAKTICLSMEQAGIMGDQPSDAIDTCTGLLLPDGATNDDARQVMIGCARAVIGRSAAPPDDPPLDMNVLAGCVQLARDQGFAPEAADYLDALAFCYLARLSAPPTACRAVERPGDLALSAVKLKSLAQAPECPALPAAEPAPPPPPPPSPPVADDGLGNHITERGPSWTGSWTRDQGTTTWKATYAGGTGAPTTMTVTRTATTLSAVRTQSSDGNLCRYEGNFLDARTVRGTATCPGSNQTNVTTFEFMLTLDDR